MSNHHVVNITLPGEPKVTHTIVDIGHSFTLNCIYTGSAGSSATDENMFITAGSANATQNNEAYQLTKKKNLRQLKINSFQRSDAKHYGCQLPHQESELVFVDSVAGNAPDSLAHFDRRCTAAEEASHPCHFGGRCWVTSSGDKLCQCGDAHHSVNCLTPTVPNSYRTRERTDQQTMTVISVVLGLTVLALLAVIIAFIYYVRKQNSAERRTSDREKTRLSSQASVTTSVQPSTCICFVCASRLREQLCQPSGPPITYTLDAFSIEPPEARKTSAPPGCPPVVTVLRSGEFDPRCNAIQTDPRRLSWNPQSMNANLKRARAPGVSESHLERLLPDDDQTQSAMDINMNTKAYPVNEYGELTTPYHHIN